MKAPPPRSFAPLHTAQRQDSIGQSFSGNSSACLTTDSSCDLRNTSLQIYIILCSTDLSCCQITARSTAEFTCPWQICHVNDAIVCLKRAANCARHLVCSVYLSVSFYWLTRGGKFKCRKQGSNWKGIWMRTSMTFCAINIAGDSECSWHACAMRCLLRAKPVFGRWTWMFDCEVHFSRHMHYHARVVVRGTRILMFRKENDTCHITLQNRAVLNDVNTRQPRFQFRR